MLSRIAQSSLRAQHNTGCGCNNAITFLTLPKRSYIILVVDVIMQLLFLLYPKDHLKMCTNQLQLDQTGMIDIDN